MSNKPVLAILLEFGFHEIKKYIHSGFAKKLSEHFDIVWLAINKNNKAFDDYFRNTGFPLIYIETENLPLETRIESYNQSVRRSYSANYNQGLFHNYTKVKGKSFKTLWVGNWIFRSLFEKLALRKIKQHYQSEYLAGILKTHHVDLVLTTSYNSSFAKSAMVTANHMNLNTFYLVNSWKDLFVNNFLPFNFLTGIFVWSERMKQDYLREMKYLNQNKVLISGNPTFDILIDSKPKYPREYYASKYQLPLNARWILYTMMPPGLVNDEIDTIQLVANELLKTYKPDDYCILIRRNPNHDKSDFIDLKFTENLKLAEHYCTFDKNNDMIVQSTEGEQEWIDLLHHCDINFSVPSTVTLEFLTLGKPVLNIGFGPDGNEDIRVRQHFEAGFYRPLFEENNVNKVMDIAELNIILSSLPATVYTEKINSQMSSADRIIEIMFQTCKK